MFEVTYYGLMKWYSHEVGKFGWMITLALNNTEDEFRKKKINLYLESLNELYAAIDNKIKNVQEVDRKNDLQIIQNNLSKFISVANKILTINSIKGGAKKTSKKTSKKSLKKNK
jgi:hypothetical protein